MSYTRPVKVSLSCLYKTPGPSRMSGTEPRIGAAEYCVGLVVAARRSSASVRSWLHGGSRTGREGRARLAEPDKLVEFAAQLVRNGRPRKTVARTLGITEDKIAEEERCDAKTRAMGGRPIAI